jgi:hypothetical protein
LVLEAEEIFEQKGKDNIVAGQKERREKEKGVVTYLETKKVREPFVRLKEMGDVGGKGGKGSKNSENPLRPAEPFDRYKEMGKIDEPLTN